MIAGQLQEHDCRVAVLWFSRMQNLFQSELSLRKQWMVVPVPPFYAAPRLVCKATRFMTRMIARLVVKAWRIQMIVAENPTSAAICAGIGVPLICDFHGDGLAERKMYQMPETEISLALNDERTTCRGTAGWICASDALRQVLSKRHGISVPTAVVPCCVDLSMYEGFELRREEARNRLGLGDKWVVCYLGGLGKWQEIPRTLSIVAGMRAREPRVFFLFITPDSIEQHEIQLAAIGKEGADYVRLSLSRQEVIETLPAADIGMLIRTPSPVNYVSSPTKCGEYLAAGVPVLTTVHAGDAAKVISKTNAGLVLDGAPDLQESAELALKFLLTAMDDRVSIAKASHHAAAKYYNKVHSLESMSRLLTEVLPGWANEERREFDPAILR